MRVEIETETDDREEAARLIEEVAEKVAGGYVGGNVEGEADWSITEGA